MTGWADRVVVTVLGYHNKFFAGGNRSIAPSFFFFPPELNQFSYLCQLQLCLCNKSDASMRHSMMKSQQDLKYSYVLYTLSFSLSDRLSLRCIV